MKNNLVCNICIMLFYVFCFSQAVAQTDSTSVVFHKATPKHGYAIGVEPFYLFNGGLRLNFEKRLNDSKNWLQLHLCAYHLPKTNDLNNHYWTINEEELLGLKGFSIGGTYKAFNPFKNSAENFYFSTGISYTYYRVDYIREGYLEFIEDDMLFYEYGLFDDALSFNKININGCMGIRAMMGSLFFFDVNIGIGASYSFYDKAKESFNDYMFGYGYRGITLVGGFSLGFAF